MLFGEEDDKGNFKIEYLGDNFSKDLKINKVIVLGLYGVWKTCIIQKLMNKEVDKEYAPTMSIDIKNFQVKVNDKIIQIQIWDICSKHKYAQNMPNLFQNTSLSIIVYAINNISSFNNLRTWYNLVKEYSLYSIIFLIGNKSD